MTISDNADIVPELNHGHGSRGSNLNHGQHHNHFKDVIRTLSHISLSKIARKFSHHQLDFEVKRPVYSLDNFDAEYGYDENKVPIKQKLKEKAKKSLTCSKQRFLTTFVSFFPILTWFPEWLKEWKINALADFLAGLTVGIMSIPQGMAYTRLAGLNPIFGLYTNLIPTIIYVFLGSAKHAAIGTVAVLSLMMGAIRYKHLPYEELDGPPTAGHGAANNSSIDVSMTTTPMPTYDFTPIELAVSCSMLIGLLLLLMGLLRLGFVSNYLSDQLVGGFTSGAAIHVFTSQVDAVFGIKLTKFSGPGKIFQTYIELFSKIKDTNIATLIISLICIAFLLLCKEFLDKFVQKKFRIPIPSELIVVIIGTLVSGLVNFHDKWHVKIVEDVKAGFPIPTAPRFDIMNVVLVDGIILAIVCYCLSVSLAKLYAKKHNYKIDAYQEFYAYSAINIVGSFFQCFPSGQSVARSIVYDGAGAKSQIAGLIGSVLVIFVILWIAPYLAPLPQCCLGAIIVVACIEMLHQMKELKNIWKISKIDFSIYMVTFISVVVLDVTYGLGLSVLYAFCTVVFRTQCMNVHSMGRVADTDLYGEVKGYSKVEELPGTKVFHFSAPLYYANVENFKPKLYKRCNVDIQAMRASKIAAANNKIENGEPVKPIVPDGVKIPFCVVMDCSGFSYIDMMGINVLKQIYAELNEVGIEVFYASCNLSVRKMLQKVNVFDVIPKNHFYVTIHDAVVASLRFVSRETKKSVTVSPEFIEVLDHIIDTMAEENDAEGRTTNESANVNDEDNDKFFSETPVENQPKLSKVSGSKSSLKKNNEGNSQL